MKKFNRGFTLVELLATIAIIAILSASVFPFVSNYRTWAKDSADARSARLITDAIARYNGQVSPETGGVLITAGQDLSDISAKLMGSANPTNVTGAGPDSYIAKSIAGMTGVTLVQDGAAVVASVNGKN